MSKKVSISEEQLKEIQAARKSNKNKNVERRLKALEMRAEGKTVEEIVEATGFNRTYVSDLMKKYRENGLQSLTENNYKGNRRNMTYEEEEEFLAPFTAKAEAGMMLEVSEIRDAYEKAVGHTIGGGQIYYVLKRHGWRKVMPRSKHPNKASDEAIEASKKLTTESANWKIM